MKWSLTVKLGLVATFLSGCAQMTPSGQTLPLSPTCKPYFKLQSQLVAVNSLEQAAPKPEWHSGECRGSRSNTHRIFTCAWQLQSFAAARTFWQYQYQQLATCFSGEWFHKVDGLQASAYFRDDDKFAIALDAIKLPVDVDTKAGSKIEKHQVHLVFQAYAPLLIEAQ